MTTHRFPGRCATRWPPPRTIENLDLRDQPPARQNLEHDRLAPPSPKSTTLLVAPRPPLGPALGRDPYCRKNVVQGLARMAQERPPMSRRLAMRRLLV